MKAIVRVFFLVTSLTAINNTYAQEQSSKYEVGINGGTLIYQGDLVPGFAGNYKTIKPALGISLSRSLDPYLSVRANLTVGKISSDESLFSDPSYRKNRNFSFSTPVTEFTALLVFNPFGQNEGDTRKLTPYIFAGAGFALLNIKRDWSRVDTSVYHHRSIVRTGLAIDTLQKPPNLLFVLPVGGGLRYAISPRLSLTTEAMFRFTGSDYLDGFKHAANPKNKDNYYGISIGLNYRLGGNGLGGGKSGYDCPPVN